MLTPTAMSEFLGHFSSKLGLGKPHLVAPDVGASAALFLAARHPDAVTSLVIGGGGRAGPPRSSRTCQSRRGALRAVRLF